MSVTYLVRARKLLGIVVALGLVAAGCGGSSTLSKDGGHDVASPDVPTLADHVGGPDAQTGTSPDAPSPTKCDGGARITGGQTCGCGADCQSGFCVDGVCCDTACGDTCKACNVPGAMGTCSFVPEGLKPRAAATCLASDAKTCGLDGTCDGQGACRKYVTGTVCGKGTCSGAAVTGILACDGAGQCKPGDAKICVPFSCDTTTQDCAATCVTSADCAVGHQCMNGSCGLKLKGISCATNAECDSGFCTDGVCCAVACTGACVSCNQTGRLGTCWPTDTGNPDPRGVCKDAGPASCGQTGACDGFGGCAKYAPETVCVVPSCSGDRLNTAGTCDGLGTCKPPGLEDCTPYRCVSGTCNPTCTTDADCVAGIACVNHSCGLKKPGGVCTKGTDCASGFCADGVCCNTACGGACRNCALASSLGTCTPVAMGTADNRGVCKDQGAASCGTSGRCDGAGGCSKYATGTVCAGEACTANVYTGPSTCSSTGQCVAPGSVPCAPYACNGTKCFESCTVQANCTTNNVCNVNSCGLKNPGASCSAGTECASKVCAQGVCCVTTCNASCKSCNLPSSLGTCTNVATGTIDPKALCLDQGQGSCGTNSRCVAGACQKYAAGTVCKGSTCPSGSVTFTAQSTCDGAGTCNTPGSKSCFPFACGATSNVCSPTCSPSVMCAPNATCSAAGSCGLKPPGGQCASSAECATGLVCSAQNVCCNAVCNGPCVSCTLSATMGTCSPVGINATDPSGQCGVAAPSTCGNDGKCDGKGACQKYSASTQCAPPSCPATTSTVTLAKTCDGAGNCSVGGGTGTCGTFLCNGPNNACNQTCQFNTDCAMPNTCVGNLCGKKPAGATCATSDQCVSGLTCTDGFCCNTGSALGTCGSCRACDATGSCQNTTASCTTTNKCFVMSGTCSGGSCVSAPVSCDDGDPCTTDSCSPTTGCAHTPATGPSCNDSNSCTTGDTCQSGVCKGTAVTCPGGDQCNGAQACDPATGLCAGSPLPNGTTCDDGNKCTQSDSCQNGTCAGANPITCGALDQCHTAGTCTPLTGVCSNPAKPNNSSCGSGNACTTGDSCQNGVCQSGTMTTCPASDQCHAAGVCNSTTGMCTNPAVADGTTCNDGNSCTTGDTCQSGVCGGSPVVCTASDQCHLAGTCNGGTCSNPAMSDGSVCNDGNACTPGTDTCQAGVCTGGSPVVCQASDQCHVVGTCDPTSGLCSNPTGNEGASCSNGIDSCDADTCVLGICVGACMNDLVCVPGIGVCM